VELASHEGSVGDLPTTLVDPNADKPLFWSDKKKEFRFLNSGSGIKVDSDDDGEGNISLDLEAGTGIAVDGNTISIDLAEGAGIDIAGNTISVEPNLQTINALTFAADKLIRITGAPAADLIDFKMGLYTPTAVIVEFVNAVTPLESMYVNIGPLVGVFGRFNLTPQSGKNTQKLRLSIPVPSDFANPRDAVGTGTSSLIGAGQIESDPVNNDVLFIISTTGSAVSTAFSFIFWYRILPWP
jgi:hypothetical protein